MQYLNPSFAMRIWKAYLLQKFEENLKVHFLLNIKIFTLFNSSNFGNESVWQRS
ncbi:hypothetical protein LguiB_012966 [Lonicera macranthoides]